MSGRGKGAKSAKSGAAKRHRKPSTSANKISGPAVRRLARRAGVPRVGSGCFVAVNKATQAYLSEILEYCKAYCVHAKRKTINCTDVIYALKRTGTRYMGF